MGSYRDDALPVADEWRRGDIESGKIGMSIFGSI